MADAKSADKEKKPAAAPAKPDATAAAQAAPLFSKKGLIIAVAAFVAWAVLCFVIARFVFKADKVEEGADPGKESIVGGPVIGPTKTLLSERIIPFRSIKEPAPVAVLTVVLEFPKSYYDENGKVKQELSDVWQKMQDKVEMAKPLLESEIWELVSAKEIHELRGPENKRRLEGEIKTRVNEILSKDGKGSAAPVENVIITELKFPQ